RVKGTLFKRRQHEISIARKVLDGNLRLKIRRTEVPYQGFVNQYMDMNGDEATAAVLNYNGKILGANIESVFSYQKTDHYMNKILTDRSGSMPMHTKSNEKTFKFKAGKDW